MKRTLIIVAIVLALAAAVGGGLWYKAVMPGAEVLASPVSRGVVEETIEEKAEAILDRTRVLTTLAGGVLEPVALDPGDTVAAGETVARIRGEDLASRMQAQKARIDSFRAQARSAETQKPKPAQFERARLAVRAAKNRLAMAQRDAAALEEKKKLADKNLERALRLKEEGLAEEARVDELEATAQALAEQLASARESVAAAETAVEAAKAAAKLLEQTKDDPKHAQEAYEAQARAAEAALETMRIEKRRLEVCAPFEGVVLERLHEGGAMVQAGTPVLLLGDPSSLEVEVEILSDDAGLVREGMDAVVFGGALGDRELGGTVRKIYPRAFTKVSNLGIEQQRVRVRIRLPGDVNLRHGFHVEARIVTERTGEEALRIPSGAVFTRNEKDCVFVVEQGLLHLREIETGLSNEDWTEIRKGLAKGDEVVGDPREELKEGMKVEVRGEDGK